MNFLIRNRDGKVGRGEEAFVLIHDTGNFSIVLGKSLAPLAKAVAWLHEIMHVFCKVFLPFQDEEKEHEFIKAMERDLKKNIRKYWSGK